jgi:hypothetical protein
MKPNHSLSTSQKKKNPEREDNSKDSTDQRPKIQQPKAVMGKGRGDWSFI